MTLPDYTLETAARTRGFRVVAGVDEAGRGPLAGPVVAAAVVLDPARIPDGLNDSKKIGARAREGLLGQLRICARIGIGTASVEEIDRINILRASHLAMTRAIADLPLAPDLALIDGNMLPRDLVCRGEPVVKGDARCLSIAAASIVAKCTRDAVMVDLAQQHPGYGWEKNAAYPTQAHLQAIRDLGVTPHHRRSFKPVHNILCREKSVTH